MTRADVDRPPIAEPVERMMSEAETAVQSARAEILGRSLVPGASRVLEIGALDRPIFTRPSYEAFYLDHASAGDLRAKYDGDPNVGQIVDVDVIWDGTVPLVDVANGQQFDLAVASHVIEHIPNPIGWLRELATVLPPGGAVGLVVPDKRFTFDYNRRLTDVSDLVDAYVRRAVLPSYAQLYDFHTKALPVDAGAVWAGVADYAGQVRPGDLRREALNGCITLRDTAGFQDVHCHTFTPQSFVDLFAELEELELLPFRILELVPTAKNTIEFYVRLERLDPDAGRPALTDFTDVIATADQVPGARATESAAPRPMAFQVSLRERKLVEAKRRAVIGARRLLRRS